MPDIKIDKIDSGIEEVGGDGLSPTQVGHLVKDHLANAERLEREKQKPPSGERFRGKGRPPA